MKYPKLSYLLAAIVTTTTSLVISATASAHVVVKPTEVGAAAFQTFTAGVPNEKDIDVTGLRIVIQDDLNYVTPTVKPGWTIETKKTGSGEDAKVSEISWTGGTIPSGQRDDFTFSAQVPEKPGTVVWKAYQTYADGSVAAWENPPTGDHDSEDENKLPYSETAVVDDLAATAATDASTKKASDAAGQARAALIISIVSLALGVVTLSRVVSLRK